MGIVDIQGGLEACNVANKLFHLSGVSVSSSEKQVNRLVVISRKNCEENLSPLFGILPKLNRWSCSSSCCVLSVQDPRAEGFECSIP